MDQLWASGWRHFGTEFFRYSHTIEAEKWKLIQPLRIRLADFSLTRSQTRVLRKNSDLRHEFQPAAIREDTATLFHLHKQRFAEGVPESLTTFLSPEPAQIPCPCRELRVHLGDALIASSFLDLGVTAASGIYGVFHPDHHRRSLGIFTMLIEIQWCIETDREFYYPGYSTREPGLYDYKKQFRALEHLDWETGQWKPGPT